MTLQEAIETVENGELWDKCIIPGDNDAVLKFHKALDIMIAELQAKREPVKLDRDGWAKCDGCELCKSDYAVYHIFPHYKFCPMCGRPLTEDAWVELERRINCGTTD